MKRIAAAVAVGVVAAAGFTAAPARADAPRPISAEPPGLAYVHLADGGGGRSGPSDSVSDPVPSASARTSPARATATSSFVAPPNEDFVFRFDTDVPAGKRAAFEAAAGIWSDVLEVEVPIQVGVSVESFADPGILGGAAPGDLFANHPSFPQLGTWYVSALANQFARKDLDPSFVEISVVISRDHDFYEGADGQVPADKVSLMALALHELGHGLGHTTLSRRLSDGSGVLDFQGLVLSYDAQLRTSGSVPFTDLTPSELGRALTRDAVWGGREGIRRNGGTAPKVYAPTSFQLGSSISHLDEATFTNALMTPFLANGEAQTSVPALTRGMFADFGWGVEARTRSETFVTAASRDFVKRFPSPSDLRRIADELDAGVRTRRQLATAYGTSDAWIGGTVDALYLTTLGRPADPDGKAFWSSKLRSGTPSATVAASFFASSEYFLRSGGTNRGWVRALYVDILGREPDAAGLDAWVAAADGGTTRTTIAHAVYQAPESRGKRVTGLYQALLGRDPDAAGLAHWKDVLRNGRDIDLAITLASSREYDDRAFGRFG